MGSIDGLDRLVVPQGSADGGCARCRRKRCCRHLGGEASDLGFPTAPLPSTGTGQLSHPRALPSDTPKGVYLRDSGVPETQQCAHQRKRQRTGAHVPPIFGTSVVLYPIGGGRSALRTASLRWVHLDSGRMGRLPSRRADSYHHGFTVAAVAVVVEGKGSPCCCRDRVIA